MNKKIVFFAAVILSIIGYSLFFSTQKKQPDIHYHAGFIVYIHGVRQDYSDGKYMHISPCVADDTNHPKNNQLNKAHLHDFIGDVVHVHAPGALWSDLFTNSNIKLPSDSPIIGYQNGNSINDILQKPIEAYQSIIIVIGSSDGIQLSQTISKEHIIEVEQKSETCGS